MVRHEEILSRHRCIFAEICGNMPKTSPIFKITIWNAPHISLFKPNTPESLQEGQREGYENFSSRTGPCRQTRAHKRTQKRPRAPPAFS